MFARHFPVGLTYMGKTGQNTFKWNLYKKQEVSAFSSNNKRLLCTHACALFLVLNLQKNKIAKQTFCTDARQFFSAMPGALPLAGKRSRERHRGERRLPNARIRN
jgi:hypothetical protein